MNRHRQSTELRRAVSELAQENSLSASELKQLRELSQDRPALPSRRRWLSVAAGLGAVSLGGFLGVGLIGRGSQAHAMAEEIAFNHLRKAPLDIESANLEELRQAFAGLGFGLLDAAEVEDVPGQLAGGRFCSVASVPAAMLIYQTGNGPVTVYQARYDERRHRGAADMDRGQAGNVIFSAGVKVCLCHTRGILLATASSGELA
jgi:anti-sigma factor RsiW